MRLVEFAGPDEVAGLVGVLAERINSDYRDKTPVLVGVLNGAFMFVPDLARRLDVAVEVDFVRASSYGNSTASSGSVSIIKTVETELRGRDVIVVEDIVDTGRTLAVVLEHIKGLSPSSVRVCSLLDKPSRRVVECRMDYVGMEVEDRFIVGYGLDLAGRYRNLGGLYLVDGAAG